MALVTSTISKRNAWIQWLDHCPGRYGHWSNPTFFGTVIGGVPTPAVEAFAALEQVLKATGYNAKSKWAYNFRGISGKPCSCSNFGNCSLHTNGIAIDIDPVINPFIATSTFSWNATAFTSTQIAAVEAIKNKYGEQMWFWGGRWDGIKDYMHFELQVTPTSCVVDWSTVAGSYDEMAIYRTVRNVPEDSNGKPVDWAKDVIDDGIAVNAINVNDKNPDDWNKSLTYGVLWTILDRLGWPKGSTK